MIDLSALRSSTGTITKAFKSVGISALEAADRMSAVAVALSGLSRPPLPVPGDYVRISQELDQDYGRIGEVLWVERRPFPDVHVKLNPFGDGLRERKQFDGGDLTILNAMEVLAEASR